MVPWMAGLVSLPRRPVTIVPAVAAIKVDVLMMKVGWNVKMGKRRKRRKGNFTKKRELDGVEGGRVRERFELKQDRQTSGREEMTAILLLSG